jgi:ferric-dicitrate binding protein FerR (iron transport regulator)
MGSESEAYLSIGSGRIAYEAEASKFEEPVLNRIEIPHGGEYMVTLPDGSELFVNSETVVEYYVPFRDNSRELKICGEVYLEVARDTARPFIVTTNDYSVRVLGTKFNVSAYPNDDFVATTLVSGSVSIEGLKSQAGKRLVLEPSQQLFLDKSSHQTDILSVDPDIYTAWTEGFFVFEEETLYSIFRKLERWYDIKVFFFSEEAEHELFSGKLPRFENLQDILSIINKVSAAKLELNGSTVVIE